LDAEVKLLPSIHRLRKSGDFQAIRRRGKKHVYPSLIIYILPGFFPDGPTQIGITVGKDCGNSVARHRLSRRIRGAVAPVVSQLPPGCGVVIRALPQLKDDQDFSDTLTDFADRVKS
jgi:ribonuclease P protein component